MLPRARLLIQPTTISQSAVEDMRSSTNDCLHVVCYATDELVRLKLYFQRWCWCFYKIISTLCSVWFLHCVYLGMGLICPSICAILSLFLSPPALASGYSRPTWAWLSLPSLNLFLGPIIPAKMLQSTTKNDGKGHSKCAEPLTSLND